MDDDTEVINSKDNYPTRTFYDSSRCIPKTDVRRQTRYAVSDVGFRIDRDLVRIPENENVRRKRRTKPQHCPSCLSQSVHNHPIGSRPYDQHRRKSPEKVEASLSQHVEYATSKMPRSHGKNRSVHRQSSPLSPRAVSAHQRSQHHRPGTSQNRNNPVKMMGNRFVGKHENIEGCTCTRLDPSFRDIVNSDDPTEIIDFQLSRQHMDREKIYRKSELYWQSPSGEPHSETELDSPPQDHHRDYKDSKKRKNGPTDNCYENCRVLDTKLSIETGSSVEKDVRDQYERDQREIKNLYEAVGEFEKRKSAAWITNDAREEKCAWVNPKQRPEKEDQDAEDSQYLLKSINEFVGKLPVERKLNDSRGNTTAKVKVHSKDQNERSRAKNSKLDTRKTYHSVGMDGRSAASGDQQQQEVGRNFDVKLAGCHLESLKREEKKEEEGEEGEEQEEETTEVEDISDTEEEARELAREEHATKKNHRQVTKSWDLCKRQSNPGKSQIFTTGKRITCDLHPEIIFPENKEEKMYAKRDCGKKEAKTRERSRGKGKKEVMICEESEPLNVKNYSGTNEAEQKDIKRPNTRERSRENEEMTDKMYEEYKTRYGPSSMTQGAQNLEVGGSKTRSCIDEIIDNGLSRETKRGNSEIIRTIVKPKPDVRLGSMICDHWMDLLCETDGLEATSLRQGANEETNTNKRPDGSSSALRSDEQIKASRSDCFCKTLAEMVTDYQGPQEYIKKLKNYRLTYLNHIQSDLEKLYSLEKYLESCSPERDASSVTLTTTGFTPDSKESKNISDKRDKAKGSGTQSRS